MAPEISIIIILSKVVKIFKVRSFEYNIETHLIETTDLSWSQLRTYVFEGKIGVFIREVVKKAPHNIIMSRGGRNILTGNLTVPHLQFQIETSKSG